MSGEAAWRLVQRSGVFQAGAILILVGAVLSTLTAVGAGLLAIGAGAIASFGGEGPALAVAAAGYGLVGILAAAGAIVGFRAYASAVRGEAHRAWILGLVSSLLPPVQALTLAGAILCKVSPECSAHDARRAWAVP